MAIKKVKKKPAKKAVKVAKAKKAVRTVAKAKKAPKKTAVKSLKKKEAKEILVDEEEDQEGEKPKVVPEKVEYVSDEELDTFFDDDYPEGDSDYDRTPKEPEPKDERVPDVVEEATDEEW